MRLRSLQTFSDQIHLVLWRFDPFGGFLLEAVQHVDLVGDLDGVNRTIRVAHVVFDDFQHARSTKALKRLGLIVLFSHLRKMECEPKDIHDIIRHREQIFF
jgi:hypothetical protein